MTLYIPLRSDKTSFQSAWADAHILPLYIPLRSDKTFNGRRGKIDSQNFISHSVQIKHKRSRHHIKLRQPFISHSVQIKPEMTGSSNPLVAKYFISHSVQIKRPVLSHQFINFIFLYIPLRSDKTNVFYRVVTGSFTLYPTPFR